MSEPAPYYESPPDAPSRVRLYLGDCRDILPLVAPPSKKVIVLADPPYGVNERTARARAGRGKRQNLNDGALASKDWKRVAGDRDAFNPSHLLIYPRLVAWGWNHFGDKMPPTPSLIVWDKRAGTDSDDNADGEAAWTNLGGPLRIFRHLWRGCLRSSERQEEHLHPTQKPEAFYRWLFAGRGRGKPTVNPGDIVVSPYLGSGPEIGPSTELGLDFIGVDVDRDYLDTAIEYRIEPALKAGKQLDIWKPKPRHIQTSLF